MFLPLNSKEILAECDAISSTIQYIPFSFAKCTQHTSQDVEYGITPEYFKESAGWSCQVQEERHQTEGNSDEAKRDDTSHNLCYPW